MQTDIPGISKAIELLANMLKAPPLFLGLRLLHLSILLYLTPSNEQILDVFRQNLSLNMSKCELFL